MTQFARYTYLCAEDPSVHVSTIAPNNCYPTGPFAGDAERASLHVLTRGATALWQGTGEYPQVLVRTEAWPGEGTQVAAPQISCVCIDDKNRLRNDVPGTHQPVLGTLFPLLSVFPRPEDLMQAIQRESLVTVTNTGIRS